MQKQRCPDVGTRSVAAASRAPIVGPSSTRARLCRSAHLPDAATKVPATASQHRPLIEAPASKRLRRCANIPSPRIEEGWEGAAKDRPLAMPPANSSDADSVCKAVPDPRLAGRGWHERGPPPEQPKRRRVQTSLPAIFELHAIPPVADPTVTVVE